MSLTSLACHILRPIAAALPLALVAMLAGTGSAEETTAVSASVDPANRPVIGLQYEGPIRVVYEFTEDDWKDGVGKGLFYLKKLRTFYAAQGIDPSRIDIRGVYHGEASTHLLTDEAYNRVKGVTTGNPNTKFLSELIASGVHVEMCDSRRRQLGWAKADLHPDVLLVAGAFPRLVDLQLQGYAYIRF